METSYENNLSYINEKVSKIDEVIDS